jgi:hypothetical protein
MAEYKATRIAQVVKVAGEPITNWLVYIYTGEGWEKECSTAEKIAWIDIFAGMDEVTALSRARMVYPNFVIGDNQEGTVKEWR